jgi:hypothetical protein
MRLSSLAQQAFTGIALSATAEQPQTDPSADLPRFAPVAQPQPAPSADLVEAKRS